MEKSFVLGVDIGGSHITAAVVDLEIREIIPSSYKRKCVNSQAGADVILNSWCEVINNSFESLGITNKRIGIAMPGPFDYVSGTCLIREQEKFRSLYQLNLKKELSRRLNIPVSNIEFINDAAGFLQGEVFADPGSDNRNVLGLTLGTGLGSALYINKIASDAALWDSAYLDGIAEDYLSTRWFIKRYFDLSGKRVEGVKDLIISVDHNPRSAEVFSEFGYNLAHFIMPLIIQHKLEMVIIGGNISRAFKLFEREMMTVLSANHIKVNIKVSGLQENAALIGAASCFKVPPGAHQKPVRISVLSLQNSTENRGQSPLV